MGGSTPAAPGRIFISYRRQETAYPAAWLYERVAAHFGREQVFKDVDSIVLGDDFAEVIANAVGSCDVLLALIGERWLMITDEDGRRRLDDPDDFVRLEIETALERNIRVIPVLFEGARLPRAGELPASLARLVRRQALELSPSRFDADIGKLLRVLDATLAEEQARREAAARAAREAEEQTGREVEARAAREAEEQAGREEEERKLSAIDAVARELRSGDPLAVASAEGALRRLAQDTNQRVAEAAARVVVDWEAAKQAQREAEDQQARRDADQAAREAEERARREQAAQAAREAQDQTRRDAEASAAREAEEQARREAEQRELSAVDAVAQELRSGKPLAVASAEGALRRLANDTNQRVAQAATSVLTSWQAEAKAQREAEAQAEREAEEQTPAEEHAVGEADEQTRGEAKEQATREAIPVGSVPTSSDPQSELSEASLPEESVQTGAEVDTGAAAEPTRWQRLRAPLVSAAIVMVLVVGGILIFQARDPRNDDLVCDAATKTCEVMRFSAASPWHLEVSHWNCLIQVKLATGTRETVISELMDTGLLQGRRSGEFIVAQYYGNYRPSSRYELCNVKLVRGSKNGSLPITVDEGGIDSPAFQARRFHVHLQGTACYAQVYRSSNGAKVTESKRDDFDVETTGRVWLRKPKQCVAYLST